MKSASSENNSNIIDAHDHWLAQVRAQFPILRQLVNGRPLVYFDNGATSQKPLECIESIQNYYSHYNSNVHRSAHHLSALATDAFEKAREVVASYLGVSAAEGVIFTRGTTESINLIATSYGGMVLKSGDEVLVSEMEHHSNIVPWQMICERTGAQLKVIPVTDNGALDMASFKELLNERTRIVSVAHVSNALGTINPICDIAAEVHRLNAVLVVDGAQAAPHGPIEVEELGADFYCFSSHKVYGPTGMGVMWGRPELLESMPPYQFGGEMIDQVRFEKTTFNRIPYRFEAGTPNIAGAVGLTAALNFVNRTGPDKIKLQEQMLLEYATARLNETENLRIYGTTLNKVPVFSFTIKGIHTFDLGVLLDQQGIAVRTGHHCCQPLMSRYGIEGTCRASLAFYNTKSEIDLMIEALEKACKLLR